MKKAKLTFAFLCGNSSSLLLCGKCELTSLYQICITHQEGSPRSVARRNSSDIASL